MKSLHEVDAKESQDMVQGIHRHHGSVLGRQGMDPLDAVIAVQDGPDLGHEARGKVRGLQAPVGTAEQGLSQFLLQGPQHPAESLMGDVQDVRRGLNVAGTVGFHEIHKLFAVHIHLSRYGYLYFTATFLLRQARFYCCSPRAFLVKIQTKKDNQLIP